VSAGGAGADVNPDEPLTALPAEPLDDEPLTALPAEPLDDDGASRPRTRATARPAAPARSKRRVPPIVWVAGLFLLFAASFAVSLAVAGLRSAGSQADAERWTVLFRADDPSVWDTDSTGKKFAVPLRQAPATFRYLRLRRMDTEEALVLPLTPDQLRNGKPPARGADFWWNGTAKEDWKGQHLGIVQAPRYKFPVPHGMIAVMTENWDAFTGSGFGHKAFVNDRQYYCWRGKEIPRTVFEIAVSDGPLTKDEERCLLTEP
jgi:hypothetical protein